MVRAWLVACVLLSGCITELLAADEVTQRSTACAVLAGHDLDWTIVIVAAGATLPLDDAIVVLQEEVANAAGRPLATMSARLVPGAISDVQAWAGQLQILDGRNVRTHVLVTAAIDDLGHTMLVAGPGAFAISADAVRDGAARTGLPLAAVAQAVFLHGAGHVLGVVNWGIPMHGNETAGREEPMHHEPGDSVMSAAWHFAAGMHGNLTHDRYSDGVRADWTGAAEACA